MILDGPGVIEPSRGLEPLRSLDAIHPAAHERDDALGVEAAGVRERLQEDLVDLVELGAVLGRLGGRLVDRLEGHQRGLAAQLLADLEPRPVHLLLDHGEVGVGLGYVRPFPGVCFVVQYLDMDDLEMY